MLEFFYDTLYSGCVMSWCVLGFSIYGSFRHGANRSPRQQALEMAA